MREMDTCIKKSNKIVSIPIKSRGDQWEQGY